jgi:hypothetical protein
MNAGHDNKPAANDRGAARAIARRTVAKWVALGSVLALVLSASLTVLGAPGWVTVWSVAALAVLTVPYVISCPVLAGMKAALSKLEPIREDDWRSCLDEVEADAGELGELGFEQVDGFCLPTMPESVVLLFAHGVEPVTAALYVFRAGRTIEINTVFSRNVQLATTNSKHGGLPLVPMGWLRQAFPETGISELMAEHGRAAKFVQSQGLTPIRVAPSDLRDRFVADGHHAIAHVEKSWFWPLKALYGSVFGVGQKYRKRIEDQYSRGAVRLP